jgi:1-acyl-sn-glycerol-3-phosphate acyltransferase
MKKSSLFAKAAHLRGCATISLMALNTIMWTTLLFAVTACKAAAPLAGWRRFTGRVMVGLANSWIACNNGILRLVNKVEWRFHLPTGLDRWRNYLVISNHQSWCDILALQRAFLRRIPFLRFFLKQNLIYVPLLGQAWWALDFPFVKRGSKRSKAKGGPAGPTSLDFVTKACAKYREIPVSIMNFVEGTRFTMLKHQRQDSQYANLLKPKAGGVATVLSAMPDCLHSILDVTIAYPGGAGSFWEFICSRGRQVVVHVEERRLAGLITDERLRDQGFRTYIEGYLNDMWANKERRLARLTGGA